MGDTLETYRKSWQAKPLLQDIYDDFYERIIQACVPGRTVEIGGGIGMLKRRLPDLITTDIQFAPWLDCVADAQALPFAENTISNIAMVDVLHHVEFPMVFFEEAARVLRPGGRIIMVEPAITFGSSLFYRLLHHEPVVMSADPFLKGHPDPKRDPYHSNQAIPTLIASKHRERFAQFAAPLRVRDVRWFGFAVYPLSGGFRSWSLMPRSLARHLLDVERRLESSLGRLIGFRMLLVIEHS